MDVLLRVMVRLLDAMFFLGLLGSAVVVVLTTIEDVRVLLEKEDT
jgi:hypothetical protein